MFTLQKVLKDKEEGFYGRQKKQVAEIRKWPKLSVVYNS